jgi:glutamate 5-kinase
MKIVIKVGTQSILSNEGELQINIVQSLVEQIFQLKNEGNEIVFVSSGAVGLGRFLAKHILRQDYGESIQDRQILSSFGQAELIKVYGEMFKEMGMLVSQILLTKRDFSVQENYLNMLSFFKRHSAQKNMIPIVNENDTVAIENSIFTDNDELAGLIASMINADKLIILSNVEGVYSHHPNDINAKLISVINVNEVWPEISEVKSDHGRGGMVTKLDNAAKMSKLGISTHIASIRSSITGIVKGEKIGTEIMACLPHPDAKTRS